jgi:hypothetical protein
MEKSMIIVLLILLPTLVLPVNSMFATTGNQSSVNQDMARADLNTSSLVYDLNSNPLIFPILTGLKNGGNGHIPSLGIGIRLMMILESTVMKIKVDQYGF